MTSVPKPAKREKEPRKHTGEEMSDTFTKGQRVEATEYAYDSSAVPKKKKPVLGVVTGFSHDRRNVIVRRDGLKTASAYSPDFWQPSIAPHEVDAELSRLQSEVSRLTAENEAMRKVMDAIDVQEIHSDAVTPRRIREAYEIALASLSNTANKESR